MKGAVVPLLSLKSGEIIAEVCVYGYSAKELMKIPHPVITQLARRYPNCTSSPFLVYPLPTQKEFDL